ncbi:hypothetical protein FIBSPDRAFT_876020 [Athelia psychrophila]|uniref:N-acetyltransferase domain-containing protein n=1 Tax=Athelia psychrophila TaxID=1759441 RepID=A0A167X8H4_9AGAM|nr:hypothetical protein FIBSPDRAFT_876020 [Fibularhizoctonia sp. CBS 109695]
MDGRTVGYLYAARPTVRTVQVRQLYVGEQRRRNGVGSALLHFVCRAYLGDTVSNR